MAAWNMKPLLDKQLFSNICVALLDPCPMEKLPIAFTLDRGYHDSSDDKKFECELDEEETVIPKLTKIIHKVNPMKWMR